MKLALLNKREEDENQPISSPGWNPAMGDYNKVNSFHDSRYLKKKIFIQKIIVTSLIAIKISVLAWVVYYFSL